MNAPRIRHGGLGLLAVLFAAGFVLARAASPNEQDKTVGPKDGKADAAGRNWALVIGINGYAKKPLQFCVKDATLLADTLKNQCGYAAERVYLLADGAREFKDQPTRANILDTLRLVAGLTRKGDTLLVHFSGHGVSVGGKSYLVPIDARDAQPEQLISVAEVRDALRAAAADRRVLILDACHSGGEKSGGEEAMSKEFEADLKADAEGLVTLAGCRASEESLEASWRGQGLFTYWLVQGLSGAADREEAGNKDGRVEVNELYQFVHERVRTEAAAKLKHRQNPFLLAALSGKIELARLKNGTTPTLAETERIHPPQPPANETSARVSALAREYGSPDNLFAKIRELEKEVSELEDRRLALQREDMSLPRAFTGKAISYIKSVYERREQIETERRAIYAERKRIEAKISSLQKDYQFWVKHK